MLPTAYHIDYSRPAGILPELPGSLMRLQWTVMTGDRVVLTFSLVFLPSYLAKSGLASCSKKWFPDELSSAASFA